MRKFLSLFVILLTLIFVISACGYKTPLKLPNPDAKPPAKAPAENNPK